MFAEYAKSLPNLEVISATALNSPAVAKKFRYNPETEKPLKDVRNGNTFKVKNSKQPFAELGI